MAKTSYVTLIQQYPKELLFGFFYLLFSTIGQTYVFALILPELSKTFNISTLALSNYYGLITLASGLLLFYTGKLIDRINLKIYSAVIITLIAGTSIVISQAQSFIVVLISIFIFRHLGQSLMPYIGLVSITRFFENGKGRGRGLSIATTGISLSAMVAPALCVWLLQSYNWQQVFLILGLFTFIACMALYTPPLRPTKQFFSHKGHEHDHDHFPEFLEENELNWSYKQFFKHRHFWCVLPLTVMPGYLITAFIFHQGSIAQYQGWSTTQIANGFVVYGSAAIIMTFITGSLIDSFSGKKVQKFSMIPLILSLSVLLITSHTLNIYLYLGLMGVGVAMTGSSTAMWAEVYGTKHIGTIKSIIGAITIIVTAIAPIIFGYLLEFTSINNIIIGHIIYMACITALSFFEKPPQIEK